MKVITMVVLSVLISVMMMSTLRAQSGIPGWAVIGKVHHHTKHHQRDLRWRARHVVPSTPIGVRGDLTPARICTGRGACASVVAFATGAFQAIVRDFESLGYAVGHPGCLSAGHMAHSKHHWGGACDLFNQIARNRTALRQPPPEVQVRVASAHGLTSGCVWRHPDCGHFEVPGKAVHFASSR